jgi:hypothetical protein
MYICDGYNATPPRARVRVVIFNTGRYLGALHFALFFLQSKFPIPAWPMLCLRHPDCCRKKTLLVFLLQLLTLSGRVKTLLEFFHERVCQKTQKISTAKWENKRSWVRLPAQATIKKISTTGIALNERCCTLMHTWLAPSIYSAYVCNSVIQHPCVACISIQHMYICSHPDFAYELCHWKWWFIYLCEDR